MALPEESTLYIRVWSRIRCSACGGRFQYLRRYVAMSRELDYNATLASVEAEFKKHALASPEPCPCPFCGFIQADMIGAAKSQRLSSCTFFGFLILVTACIASGVGILPGEIACVALPAFVGCLTLFCLYQLFANRNRNLPANLQQAAKRIDERSLKPEQAGTSARPIRVVPAPGPTLGALAAASASIFGFVSPMLFDWALLAGEVPGLILFVFAGSRFANIAYEMKKKAEPVEITEIKTELVLDEHVPEGFGKK